MTPKHTILALRSERSGYCKQVLSNLVAATHAVVHVPGTNDIALTLNTSALSLRFIAGAFTARSLSITLRDSGTVWRPGADSSGNLNGSLNTMDCYPDWEQCIEFHQQQMQPGGLEA